MPDVEALIDVFTRGSDEIVKYLRKHETAEYLIDLVAKETGVRRVFVRVAYNLLVGLVIHRSEAGARKLTGRLAAGSARVFARLPFSDSIAQALLRLEARLRRDEQLKQRLNALMAGTLTAGEFGDVTGLSREAQLGLHALKEQEESWGELDRRFDELLGAANPRPSLTTRALAPETAALASSRLLFNARRLPFVGRVREFDALDTFLGAERRFCWWLVTGEGGLGKSRLALELCLRRSVEFPRAGFMRRESTYDAWDGWQPEAPTLIVLDYVASQVDRARRIITALRDRERELDAPVRLLLIERASEGQEWWRRFLTSDATGAEIRDSGFRPDAEPLRLGPLEDADVWATIRCVLDEAQIARPDREQTLRQLRTIDPDSRPLFVTLAADALAAGRDLRGWDRTRLLQDVLERERAQMWPEDVTPGELNLLALATMCGPLPIAMAERLSQLPGLPNGFLPDFDPDSAAQTTFRPARYVRLAGRPLIASEDDEQLPALKPDLIGEFFVLRHLTGEGGRVLRVRAERLREAVWNLPRPQLFAFGNFIHRCADDFLDEPALAVLGETPTTSAPVEAQRMWTRAAFGLVSAHARGRHLDTARAGFEAVMEVASRFPADAKVQAMASVSGSAVVGALATAGLLDEAGAIHDRLTEIAGRFPDDENLRSTEITSTSNYLGALARAGRLDEALALHERLFRNARERSTDEDARFMLVAATTVLRPALVQGSRVEALVGVYRRVAQVIAANPEPVRGVDMRNALAIEAYECMTAVAADGRSGEAHDLLEELLGLAEQWETPGVRLQAASAAVDLILRQPTDGRLDEVARVESRLAEFASRVEGPEGAHLRLALSGAGGTLMLALTEAGRAGDALTLWRRLVESALAHPDELLLRTSLLERIGALVQGAARTADVEASIHRDMHALIDGPPTLVELRQKVAAEYYELLQGMLAEDTQTALRKRGVDVPTDGLGLIADIERQRLREARHAIGLLVGIANYGADISSAVEHQIRGDDEEEGALRMLVARGAAALIRALEQNGRQDDATEARRELAPFLQAANAGTDSP